MEEYVAISRQWSYQAFGSQHVYNPLVASIVFSTKTYLTYTESLLSQCNLSSSDKPPLIDKSTIELVRPDAPVPDGESEKTVEESSDSESSFID
ncbi:hypothetical protein P7K49_020126 [Saguinus oedipus]|uniref:Uncharacterized protein n=1 Tax=Saguinus oedipus TaxID=9490 RepID=A0ABQ9V0A6_SAGOE|nr:hypothetical protein P7K49_020126 [Saguinus oedipus]